MSESAAGRGPERCRNIAKGAMNFVRRVQLIKIAINNIAICAYK